SPRGASSYGLHLAKVKVDTQTGRVKVLEFAAVQDVGRVMNPTAIEGQLEGAVQMGLGYALSEGLEFDPAGQPLNCSFKTYKMPTATEMPRLNCAFIEQGEPDGPFGGKSIGECSVVPVAPAIVNAVANALDLEFYSLPLTPEKILAALEQQSTNKLHGA
ncbi:molybdopterin-dependent oxidoreductase, partial [Deltaproteobacteria bacterium OttesenSCG-928-K17]|nr:molybdopterin-dependent oxidoreductase [Deltaproteobacteria bacterium OttesenSCG-928-K17]